MKFKYSQLFAPLLVLILLVSGGCGGTVSSPDRIESSKTTTTPSTTVRTDSTTTSIPSTIPTPQGEALAGGEFNKFFPAGNGEYSRVFTQEKTGTAQAKLLKNGKEVALFSITDAAANPSAVKKFEGSNEQIKGFPVVAQGSQGTAVLVGNRFQVKVLSKDAAFTESDRKVWLNQFNLNGLARLSPNPVSTVSTTTTASPSPTPSHIALPKTPLPGSTFNQFFPSESAGFKRVFTQEKAGTAQAKLMKDGKEMTLLSITDAAINPSSRNKFDTSSEKINGY
ncbi:MAG: hypothetical protein ACOC0N_12195, partial [Chroococcales cyanobacterium]